MFGLFRSWRRKRLLKRPFPEMWRPQVRELLPWSTRFEEAELERFLDHLKVFAWEKHWIGAGGLRVNDEMKIAISGSAARLSRNLPLDVYDRLTEIVVYPSHYKHEGKQDFVVYGEAHSFGTVVLSWDAVRRGLAVKDDGHDTAIHEFAHVLDIADGGFDGTPVLHDLDDYSPWGSVLTKHYESLRAQPKGGLLRAYGAQNPAEFFAVATEVFFEKPRKLKAKAPDLYAALKNFYRSDPLSSDGGDRDDVPRKLGRRRRRRKRKRS